MKLKKKQKRKEEWSQNHIVISKSLNLTKKNTSKFNNGFIFSILKQEIEGKKYVKLQQNMELHCLVEKSL